MCKHTNIVYLDVLSKGGVGMSSRQFVKKPVIISAFQTNKEIYIDTLEGQMKADKGDWIVTGIKGERYPVKPEIFEQTYKAID